MPNTILQSKEDFGTFIEVLFLKCWSALCATSSEPFQPVKLQNRSKPRRGKENYTERELERWAALTALHRYVLSVRLIEKMLNITLV